MQNTKSSKEIIGLHGKELELEHNFELYNRRILNENLIHPDDVELYRSRITLSSLQDIFFGGHKQLTYQFRRCLDNDYISTTMEFSPATNVMHRIHGLLLSFAKKQSETTLSENLSDFLCICLYN